MQQEIRNSNTPNTGSGNPVSNLSSALRQVHLGNSNTTTDQSNISIDYTSRAPQQQPLDELSRGAAGGPAAGGGPEGSNMVGASSAAQVTAFGGPSVVDSSRITKFFQNQPMEGYTLFSHRSAPNGFKVAIVLSEMGLNYNTIFLDFNLGEHRAPEFVAINPNARVPALIDHSLDNLSLWESGAIILHLANKYYRETGTPLLWSDNLAEQAQINSWLFFQTSGHAPMIGQALHFRYFHSQKVPSAVERYTDEVRRVYGVVEMALAERREALIMDLDSENAAAYSAGTTPLTQSRFFDYPVWLVGDHITIADLSFVPWNNVVDRIGINIKVEFPEVYKWTKHMMRRPAVIKALRGE
ncbi:ABL195Cp [Eremothecium gossypii ATCC 10895]|uniref:Protein URE2 n=1 Tax=Eremothecium gossypii (strain ATCC 10895 / CBS 109.51 / FGSC 9923 / NRRL Y-1056) TaxID=284811 RepID=URE2_EREGS|nr:ABL195Cp [Eremothecium gossypii ATCC 10895]Q8NJR2.1 RecName: Full=Protein URE2 [Eremothecium gossypii ATCC 10895]AAM91943.1 Ure2p [Eremothecium gossypii]AAS50576.1 ABL195Cp [Eremothecium gossypii ATCC 10895]AEY94864.1 FABL195Cp [Eremothecium gossypii FDAG1]